MSREATKKRVLEWINEQRKELGMRPIKSIPKAHVASTMRCPIALALVPARDRVFRPLTRGKRRRSGTFISALAWYASVEWHIWHHGNVGLTLRIVVPDHVAKFMRDFDARKYPELIA